jgi:hypothetical protein
MEKGVSAGGPDPNEDDLHHVLNRGPSGAGSPGRWINGVSCGQETKVPHLMRVHLITVRRKEMTGMKGSTIAAVVAGAITLACVAFVVVLFLVKVLWAWTVPDLFPGAVQQGLVAGSISWFTAVKVALFAALLSGFAKGAHLHIQSRKAGQ